MQNFAEFPWNNNLNPNNSSIADEIYIFSYRNFGLQSEIYKFIQKFWTSFENIYFYTEVYTKDI